MRWQDWLFLALAGYHLGGGVGRLLRRAWQGRKTERRRAYLRRLHVMDVWLWAALREGRRQPDEGPPN